MLNCKILNRNCIINADQTNVGMNVWYRNIVILHNFEISADESKENERNLPSTYGYMEWRKSRRKSAGFVAGNVYFKMEFILPQCRENWIIEISFRKLTTLDLMKFNFLTNVDQLFWALNESLHFYALYSWVKSTLLSGLSYSSRFVFSFSTPVGHLPVQPTPKK